MPPNLRDLVCGKGGSWRDRVMRGGFYSPPVFLNRAGLRGPKLGLCCPLVPGLIPRTQLLPLPPHVDGHVCARMWRCVGPARQQRVVVKNWNSGDRLLGFTSCQHY